MSYQIAAGGGTLYKVSSTGTTTALTLPTGVTLSSTRPAVMAVLGRNVIVVNGATRSVFVDPLTVVRPAILSAPSGPPVLAAGGSGALSGTFRAKYTYIIKDPDSGALLSESDFSPVSASSGVITNQLISVTGLGVSPDSAVTHRRLYRTATGPGTVYFQWFDVDGNTITTASDDTSDASLALLAAPTDLGPAPGMVPGTYMTNVVQWKNRLWGVGDNPADVDNLRYSGNGKLYGWPATNIILIAPAGADQYGITGLIPRRDELGICKRNIIWKIVGGSPTDFTAIKVIEGKGCFAPQSVQVIRDIGYFLGEDGVYTFSQSGVQSVSDDKVRTWFATDTYFNRSLYPNAFAVYNARYHSYELHLAAVGSSNLDRWVSYDIAAKQWYGPHLTTAFTPTCGGQVVDANNITTPVMGTTSGYLIKQNQTAFNDDGSAITIDLVTKFHDGNSPDIQKYWGELALLTKIMAGVGNLNIAVRVGGFDASVTQNITTADMRLGRARLPRMGTGRLLNLEFTESTLNQSFELYGYEIGFSELGRR